MKAPHQVISLYWKTVRKYRKLVSRIDRNGVTAYQRNTLLARLKKIVRRLKALHAQLKIATSAGAVLLLLSQNPATAQLIPIPEVPALPTSPLGPFIKQNRINNPLREPIFTDDQPYLSVVDFDGDGDMDVVVGEDSYEGGFLRYFENQSSDGHQLYIEREGADNPFKDIHALTENVSPALADIDRDGDLDLFLGQNGFLIEPQYPNTYTRGIEYYRNDAGTFSRQTGIWDDAAKAGNPFDNVLLGYSVAPVFVDFDSDGDLDLVAGSYTNSQFPDYIQKYVHYYQNDGSGNFTAQDINLDRAPYYYYSEIISPALADLDDDGDLDMVIGNYNDGYLRYYKQETTGNFIEQTEPWDPATQTGNMFGSFLVGRNVSPAFIDFDGDGQTDLFVADELGSFENKYSDQIINYYKNAGNGTFEQKEDFDNPFGGAFVKEEASPVLIDLDKDGDLDAVIGNKYSRGYYDPNTGQYLTRDSYLTTYVQDNGVFSKVSPDKDPFNGLTVNGNFSPQFADVDGDGDADMITGNSAGEVVFFRNDGGIYQLETGTSPFGGISKPNASSARLVDIDNDKDLDLFISNDWEEVYYFQNTGTATAPVYTERTGADNPLNTVMTEFWGTAYFQFDDLDHDGDPDLLFNGTSPSNVEEQAMLFVENTGTPEVPEFTTYIATLFDESVEDAKMFTLDYDGDGDRDAFAGNYDGTVSYLRNDNPVVNVATNAGLVQYENNASPVLLAENLTLADSDNDLIVQAIVAIQNFIPGEKLAFTPHEAITGVFDTNTGILTFRGKADLAAYQALLRTITFEASYQSGRRVAGESLLIGKSISYAVFDQDFTNPLIQSVSVEVFVNDPPVIASHTVTLGAGQSVTVDLKQIISDPNGSSDLDLTTLRVVDPASSGAMAGIDANGMLTLDYGGLTFVGAETIVLEVCDQKNSCVQSALNIVVTNTPPVIQAHAVGVTAGGSVTFNLMDIISDAEGNLNHNGFAVTAPAPSGATATIDVVSATEVNLTINYSGIDFYGSEEITIRGCDNTGACVENLVAVNVNGPPVISDATIDITFAGSATFDLKTILSDPNGTTDLNLSSLKITQLPASGAVVAIDASGVLSIDYGSLNFAGTESIGIEVCDMAGACVQHTVTVNVSNSPPVIAPEPVATTSGRTKAINLMTITSDIDGNLDPESFAIVGTPLSNAIASIEVVSPSVVNLHLNYEGVTYHGTDEITIRACDNAGACSESIVAVQVDVDGNITVYNAVAPNSSGNNRIMRILGLPENNKVTIYNRWGDKVFEVEDYVSEGSGNAFRGLNDNGATLPSGTYFYTIEIPGEKKVSGYLTLKQ